MQLSVFCVVLLIFVEKYLCQEWVQMDPSKSLPTNAIPGGAENSENYKGWLHIGRKQFDKELVIGKVIDSWKSGYCELLS